MNNSTTTPQQCESSVIYGIDVGDRFSETCGLDGTSGEILEEGRLVTTPKGFARRFAKLDPVIVAIEAGTHSRWISQQLQGYGHQVLVAHPSKVRLITDNDTKNDKLDAMRLAILARADPRLLHPIKHRGQQAQADLAIIKARDMLVQQRTKLVNHLRGTVKGFGVRLPSCTAPVFHRKVVEHVPDELRPALEPLFDQLQSLEPAIKHYNKLIKQRAAEVYPEAEHLQQVPGIGPITALAFVLTLEDPHRFPNGDSVGSYLGLRPKQRASGGPGGSNPKLRITKAGNGYLRRLLVGAAHYALGPFGPDSDLKRWGSRIQQRTGKKKAVVAVARKLGVLLHHLWITGDDYNPFHQSAPRRGAA